MTEKKARMSALTTLTQHSTTSPDSANGQEKEIKCTQIRKEEIKLSLFADYMTVKIGCPRSLQNKPLELMSSARLQDTRSTYKNELHSYIRKVNMWKQKLKIQYHE